MRIHLFCYILLNSACAARAGRWGSIFRLRTNIAALNSTGAPSWVEGGGNATNKFFIDYARVMMHRHEVDLIASYLRPTDVYLEYGSGGSTLAFSRMVKRAYSIEHDCKWARHMEHLIDASDYDYSSLNLRCVHIRPGHRGWGTISNYEHGNYVQFKEYVDKIDALPDIVFDRILIDGRARLACALKVLSRLRPDSLVFVHDFYTRKNHYTAMLEYYEEVARVLAYRNPYPDSGPIDEPQGVVVLRPREGSAGRVLTDQQINAKYAAIDWRYPFAPPLLSPWAYFNYYILLSLDLSTWRRYRSVNDLLGRVFKDMVLLFAIYALWAMFAYRLRRTRGMLDWVPRSSLARFPKVSNLKWGVALDWRYVIASKCGTPRSRVKGTSMDEEVEQPRFFETEAIKSAQARRKSRMTPKSGNLVVSQ